MIEKVYYKTTPKYIFIYKIMYIRLAFTSVFSIRINRKTKEIKKEIKQVLAKDIDIFFSRIKTLQELEDGTDILAQVFLLDPDLRFITE